MKTQTRRDFMITQTAVVATTLGMTRAAMAQPSWPTKPVHLIVTFAPGGVTDSAGRIVAEALTKRIGQAVVVENRPGAAGNVAAGDVARSDPDAYSMVVVLEGTIVINPHVFDHMGYDPMKDLVPVAKVGDSSIVMVANPSVPARTLQEAIALSKTRPGGLSFGTAGAMTITHIAGELLAQRTGAKLTHIPYRGGGPAVTDVLSGQIPLAFVSAASVQQYIKSGALVALAQQSPKRASTLPDVPTFAESGIADFLAYSWAGIFAPAKTPASLVAQVNKALNEVLADPAVRDHLSLVGIAATPIPPDVFKAEIQRQFDWYGPLLKQAGIRASG
jgi:tripartite-type tricarboxylate transporter receptor subunit TctC